jgi:hypothetical protein
MNMARSAARRNWPALLLLVAWCAGAWGVSAQTDTPPPSAASGGETAAQAEDDEKVSEPKTIRRYGDRISIFSEAIHVPEGTYQQGTIICVGSDAIIEGEVWEVVIVGGSLKLTGRVRGQVVGVLSDMELDGAEVNGQLLNVAGSLRRQNSYVGGPQFNLSLGDWVGRLPSPLGVIGAILFWIRVFKLFLAFIVVLLLAAMVPERIRLIGEETPVRYGTALLVGLVSYLGVLLVLLLLSLTVVGWPIGILVYRVLKWLGIAGIFFAVGRRIGRSMGREMSLLGAVLLAFAVFAVVTLFPFLSGLAGAGWWFVLPSLALILFGVWLFVEVPALGLIILTRAGTRSSGAPATLRGQPAAIGPPGGATPAAPARPSSEAPGATPAPSDDPAER